MARARRETRHAEIWPGFVDALSTLLLSIIFLLVVFVLGQFFLSQMLEGRDETVERLQRRLDTVSAQLEQERLAAQRLRASLAEESRRREASEAERRDVEDRLARLEGERAELDAGLRRLTVERAALERQVEEGRLALRESEQRAERIGRELEASRGELERLQREIAALTAARDALLAARDSEAAGRSAAEAEVRRLAGRIETLATQLGLLDQVLAGRQAEIDRQSARIAELGQRLNEALANRVEELAQYRSDFFGRLRQVLGDREDVRVVGDRFVFQSEVLFAPGEAELGPGAAAEIAKLAATLRDLATKIPPELPWVLQVDGHTDRRPIATARFPSNWELSTARAITVVRQLMAQGIPAERLAARGFGEFQPLDPADTEEAYRRNRRIELKLTTR
ncbi:MAG: flagellar motor protein MotB [Geminicoccaceae bacterium]|nr:MAG: flagellar motor protein MotB [Geminicoccaceae bacterium]